MAEHLKEGSLTQWHETQKIEEGGIAYFLKRYKPDGEEIKNEIGWLTSSILRSCRAFAVPEVRSASVEEGWIKMGYIDVASGPSEAVMTDRLIKSALELHRLIRTDQPHVRGGASASEYSAYTKRRAQQKIAALEGTEFEISGDVVLWMEKKIEALKTKYFSVVHRDLRARHLLFGIDTMKPTLIDWEFSDVSDPAQDLAKVIYDAVVDRRLNRDEVVKYVIDSYAQESGMSAKEIEERVRVFLPIIPLEHAMSFVTRKPEGYEAKVMADVCFVQSLYEEEK
ncbi:MAG: aminoglycoside phosphotransferase family protein [Patescibacteria group bacterium]|mgnify:FL=1